jgi:PAS domain S-box-containing protein
LVKALNDALEILQLFVFVGLGLVAFVQWRRRGGTAAGWLAATFGVLAAVVLAGRFLPVHSESEIIEWVRKLEIAVLVLFPYFLFRFMASFERPPKLLNNLAVVLTAGTILFALVLPEIPEEGETDRPTIFLAFIVVLLVQWVVLSVAVGVRLWRGGSGQPTVARRRMRMLSMGSVALAIILVVAGSAPPTKDITWFQIATQIAVLFSAGLFLLGFAPPGIVRLAWRRSEEQQLREAELGLMEAVNPNDVASVLLPHVTQLVGGRGSVLIGRGGEVTGSHGMADDEAGDLAARVASSGETRPYANSGSALSVPMRNGALAVQASPYTPFFGREETEMLQTLAVLAELAMDRAELFKRERESRDQLAEAQQIANIGSWEWSPTTGHIVWSDEMYRIYGLDPETFVPSYESVSALAHPDEREKVRREREAAEASNEPMRYETRIVRPDGDERVLFAQGKTVVDESGETKLIGTVQDITDRKRQETFREQFIANAAHELRTPMTTLVGFVEMLARKRDTMPEQQMEIVIDAMSRSGDRLAVLINNLLDLTKLQQGELEFELEPVSVHEVVRTARETTPPPEGKSLEVEVEGDPIALADRHRLDQVLTNLLTNAYRYGGPEVRIEAGEKNGSVVLSVTDNGEGIEEALVSNLFDPFTRGSASSEVGGSGLGLAIVKMLVDASGGEIWHEAETPHGARFNVRLKRGA